MVQALKRYHMDPPTFKDYLKKICLRGRGLTGPKVLESKLEALLSPSTQQCPSGTLITSRELLIHSPGIPTILFMYLSLKWVGELPQIWYTVRTSFMYYKIYYIQNITIQCQRNIMKHNTRPTYTNQYTNYADYHQFFRGQLKSGLALNRTHLNTTTSPRANL